MMIIRVDFIVHEAQDSEDDYNRKSHSHYDIRQQRESIALLQLYLFYIVSIIITTFSLDLDLLPDQECYKNEATKPYNET